MGYTSRQLLGSCLGALALPLFFLAPGYAVASLSNLLKFRSRSLLYRLGWALLLSTALSLLWAVHPYLPLSPRGALWGFELASVAGLACLVRDQWNQRHTTRFPTKFQVGFGLMMLVLALYCLLAPLAVEFHGQIYEHASSQTDWSVRIQLIDACLRGGAHPVNPMYAYHGQTVPLHTYFYWYVLCAQLALLTGISAQSALIASCVAAGMLQVAVFVLALKILRLSEAPMTRQIPALGLAMFVTGLEVLIFVFDFFHGRFRPDTQLAISDHSPGLLYTFVWSPHHVAGGALCLGGLLLVLSAKKESRGQVLLHCVLAGIFYAAAAGTSTFITALYLLACVGLLAWALFEKDYALAWNLGLAGVVALLLVIPFAHGMHVASAGAPATASAPVHFRIRYGDQAQQIAYHYFFRFHLNHRHLFKPLYELIRLVLMAFFLLCDLGLVFYVAVERGRRDWPRRHSLPRGEQVLWILFVLSSVLALFITSANDVHNANDAGYHASSVMRMVAILWAVPLILSFASAPRPFTSWQRLGVAFCVIGIVSQCVQLFTNRFQVFLVDRGWVTSLPVAERIPHVARRFDQLRDAMDSVAEHTAPDAIIQTYPHSRVAPELLMYSHRQFAASDEGCNIPFGGSSLDCVKMVRHFNALFGGNRRYHGEWLIKPRSHFNTADTNEAAFAFVCKENHLTAIVADYTSPAWQHPGTWIWTLSPVYANPSARVFLCPVDPAK